MKRNDWIQHVENQPTSGLSLTAYCRQHKLSCSSFYLARKKAAASGFIPVSVKETRESVRFEMTVTVASKGLFEFKGLTDDPVLVQTMMARALI